MFELFLFLHIAGAIVAFGPTLAFPIIGIQARREPQHANFAMRLGDVIQRRLVLPVALSMLVSGIGLMYFGEVGLRPWLVASLVVYAAAMGLVLLVMLPNQRRLIDLTAAAGPGGPSPELGGRVRIARMGGMALSAGLVTILLLMIYKPGG